jgi:hypothetical protein
MEKLWNKELTTNFYKFLRVITETYGRNNLSSKRSKRKSWSKRKERKKNLNSL